MNVPITAIMFTICNVNHTVLDYPCKLTLDKTGKPVTQERSIRINNPVTHETLTTRHTMITTK